MDLISGTYRDGRVDLDSAVDWPEGARVSVVAPSSRVGLDESEWPDTPEGRDALLARFEATEPLVLSPEDEAQIAEARLAARHASVQVVKRRMGLAP